MTERVKNDMRNMANVMETYFTDHQKYPARRAIDVSDHKVDIGTQTVHLATGDRLQAIRLKGNGYAFCLRVVRGPKAGATTSAWRYLSDRGGITVGGCPARFATRSAEPSSCAESAQVAHPGAQSWACPADSSE